MWYTRKCNKHTKGGNVSMEKQTAFITGGTTGIGREIAITLAKERIWYMCEL